MKPPTFIPGFRNTIPEEPLKPAKPGFLDILPDTFERENVIGAAQVAIDEAEQLDAVQPEGYEYDGRYTLQDANFDPFDSLIDTEYEAHAHRFIAADTPEEVEVIKSQIDRAFERDAHIASAGGFTAFMADMTAAVTSPETFIPIGGQTYRGYRLGSSVLRNAGSTAVAGALGASVSEVALQSLQEHRTMQESVINVLGGAAFGGVLGGLGGVAYLAEHGYFSKDKVDHVIIPEPLGVDQICLGHRGGWWAEIETFGEIAHGSMPFLGDWAVRHMGAVLDRFETDLFPAMAARRTEMPVVPEWARSSTMNINSIHGGQNEQAEDSTALPSHCVPDSCRIVIDRRYLAEENYEGVSGEVKDLLEGLRVTRPNFEYEMRELNHVAPSMTDKEAPVVQTVARSIEAVMGKKVRYVASPGTYDQKHIDRIGKLKNCIAYGPGILELAHKPDEYVGVEDMVDSAKVMAHALAQLLVGEV